MLAPDNVPPPRMHALGEIERLVIEIAEHAAVEDYGALENALDPHRRRGLRLAIDDTGADSASLPHIRRLNPDVIKLDRAVIERIDRDRANRAVAAAVKGYAVEMQATVTAEGIETAEQLSALQTLGVGYGQGYLLGRPQRLPVRGRVRPSRRSGSRSSRACRRAGSRRSHRPRRANSRSGS
jgi:EAL domain-containing protein (putative c-di-GMP-specific phosphodiesterase class I)